MHWTQPRHAAHADAWMTAARITADLTWPAHKSMIFPKARKLVGMLFGQFYQDADTSTLLQLYVSNIRPHLEYACQVWDPYLKDIEMLEYEFVSLSGGMLATLHCCRLNLPTLTTRRKQVKLGLLYKINVPISPRENPFNLWNINTHSLSGFDSQKNSFKYSNFLAQFCGTREQLTIELVSGTLLKLLF